MLLHAPDDAQRERDKAVDETIVDLLNSHHFSAAAGLFFSEFRDCIYLMQLPAHQRRRVLLESVGLLNLRKVDIFRRRHNVSG